MNSSRRRGPVAAALAATFVAALGAVSASASPAISGGQPAANQAFLLKLDPASTSRVFRNTRADEGRAAAKSAARIQKGRIASVQADVADSLPEETSVLYRTHSLLAGLAVTSDSADQSDLEGLDGVAAVYPIAPKSLDNSYAMPLQGAPAAWEGTGSVGQGQSIAIIDSGVDYTHANFGGPGSAAVYDEAQADEAVAADPALFPNGKVVGGYDLVGDVYNADEDATDTPHPDPNPLDCGGHGSHVAGTAAGYGENGDGSTYAGSYSNSTPFGVMNIGPGMAPEADIYAYKVFGCDGSTNVVTEAIDMAADPDGNGDPSDHVDVINMSLGSDFGSPFDGDSVAANAAVALGITLSVSAGNSGDVTDVSGSPGNASSVITVANSEDAESREDGASVNINGTPSTFAVTRSDAYDWRHDEDLSGPVVLPPETNQTACTAYPANTFSGQVVLVKWTQAALECGSAVRGANLFAAGAGGFIFANSEETFSTGIVGSGVIPGVLMVKSGADAIRTALNSSQPVSVNGTVIGGVLQTFPDDNNKVAESTSRGIHAANNLKPDVAAIGSSIFSTAVGTGTEGVSFTGTSMAAPTVAGLAALVHEQNPGWTPLQVKADIMNTAGQDITVNGSGSPAGDRYPPVRVGAGRIKVGPALDNEVLAFNSDGGGVSVSFGPVEVDGPMTLSKDVTVQNNSGSNVDYTASYDEITSVPGVEYEVSPSQFTVAAGGAQTVTVTFRVDDPGEMTKTVDPTIGRTYATNDPRETLSEASGNLVLEPEPADGTSLRVPVYSAPRPASDMSQPGSLVLTGAADQTSDMELAGIDLGSNGTNGTNTADPDDDIFSITAGFELQATSPQAPACSLVVTSGCYRLPEERAADIKYVGYSSNFPQIGNPSTSLAFFAVSSHGAWSTPVGKTHIQIDIDVDGNDEPDLFVSNQRRGEDDVFYSELYDPVLKAGNNQLINARRGNLDTALYDSDTMILPVRLSVLNNYGINAANPRISYGVETYSSFSRNAIDTIGVDEESGLLDQPMSANLFNPGIRVTGTGGTGTLLSDHDGGDVSVHRNVDSYGTDNGKGLLMLHLHNKVGNKAQVVDLNKLPQAISFSSGQESATVGEEDELNATGGGSESDVTFSTSTPDKCEIDGTTIDFIGAGTCSVEAHQAGDTEYDPAPTAELGIEVAKSSSTTSVSVEPGSINATVERPGSVGPEPGGTVTFFVGGSSVGSEALVDGVASISTEVPAGGDRHVVASYSGDPDFEMSTGSADRSDPTVTARVSSPKPRNSRGWYRTPVTVTFDCLATTAPISDGCPPPVKLTETAADQKVTRTVASQDGGLGVAAVDDLDIDRVRPTVKLRGVRKGATYRRAPRGRCVAKDSTSGILSCGISKKRNGKRVTYTARATDRAGNSASVRVKVRIRKK